MTASGFFVKSPEEPHWRSPRPLASFRLLWDHAHADAEWAAWALDQIRRWPSTKTPHARAALMDVLRAALDRQTNDGSVGER